MPLLGFTIFKTIHWNFVDCIYTASKKYTRLLSLSLVLSLTSPLEQRREPLFFFPAHNSSLRVILRVREKDGKQSRAIGASVSCLPMHFSGKVASSVKSMAFRENGNIPWNGAQQERVKGRDRVSNCKWMLPLSSSSSYACIREYITSCNESSNMLQWWCWLAGWLVGWWHRIPKKPRSHFTIKSGDVKWQNKL